MAATTPIEYKNEFAPATTEQAASWHVYPAPDSYLPTIVGKCPACGDQCEVPLNEVVVQGGVPSAVEESEPVAELTRQVICNCRTNHQWPAGVYAGCGRYWLATLTLLPDGKYQLAPEEDLSLLPAAAAFNDALATQDKRVQNAAEKWLGAVTAIYGLFSLTGLATAKDALKGLSTWSKVAVAATLTAGLAAAALALFFGYLAAYRWPRPVRVDDKDSLREWYRLYRGYGPQAAQRLGAAVGYAFAALAALAAVMILLWFLPRHA